MILPRAEVPARTLGHQPPGNGGGVAPASLRPSFFCVAPRNARRPLAAALPLFHSFDLSHPPPRGGRSGAAPASRLMATLSPMPGEPEGSCPQAPRSERLPSPAAGAERGLFSAMAGRRCLGANAANFVALTDVCTRPICVIIDAIAIRLAVARVPGQPPRRVVAALAAGIALRGHARWHRKQTRDRGRRRLRSTARAAAAPRMAGPLAGPLRLTLAAALCGRGRPRRTAAPALRGGLGAAHLVLVLAAALRGLARLGSLALAGRGTDTPGLVSYFILGFGQHLSRAHNESEAPIDTG